MTHITEHVLIEFYVRAYRRGESISTNWLDISDAIWWSPDLAQRHGSGYRPRWRHWPEGAGSRRGADTYLRLDCDYLEMGDWSLLTPGVDFSLFGQELNEVYCDVFDNSRFGLYAIMAEMAPKLLLSFNSPRQVVEMRPAPVLTLWECRYSAVWHRTCLENDVDTSFACDLVGPVRPEHLRFLAERMDCAERVCELETKEAA
jgi:hypothetical protein